MASREIIALLSGSVALILAGETTIEANVGADSDIERATRTLGFSERGLYWYTNQSLNLLDTPANRSALWMLAEELLKHREIGSIYADMIVSVADGETSMEEVRQSIALFGKSLIKQ